MNADASFPLPLRRLRLPALVVGLVAMAATLAGLLLGPGDYFRSYLFAYLFWLGVALGSLGMVMVHRLVGGEWGLMVRRIFEAAAMTLPLMAMLFIPIFFGLRGLYPWARPEMVAEDPILRFKSGYLNAPWFIGRTYGYFLLWIVMAVLLRRGSLRQERNDSLSLRSWLQRLSAGGIILYGLSMTFAGVDWVMSREPHYYSTVFGLILLVGQALSGMAFAIFLTALLANRKPFVGIVRNGHFNDLGSLLLVLVILFAYMAFAQFLINWSGNMQEEVPWYVQRTSQGWRWVALSVIALHFFVPFFLLLSRYNKQQTRILASIAGLLLVMRMVDLFWMVAPSGPIAHPAFRLYWTDFAAPIGVGGIWLATFLWLLSRQPLLPWHELKAAEALNHGGSEALGGLGG